MNVVTFRDLVQQKFYAVGFSKERVLSKVSIESGACRHSVRAALNGTRVNAETARSLTLWAAKVMKVDLSEFELLTAPTKPARTVGDPGRRAEELVEAAAQNAGLPPGLACTVSLDLASGLWNVTCRNLTGGPANEQTAPELSEAMRAVVESHYGQRSA